MKLFKKYVFPIAAALLVTGLVGLGVLRRVDRWTQDWLFQRPGSPSGDIVIIGIDEDALELLGPYNTWDRNIMASALEALAADPDKKPAVTAIDILYAGNSTQQADDRLAEAAGNLGNVVTACMAQFGEKITWENGRATSVSTSAILAYEEPFEALRSCTRQGHINAMMDVDGVMRHGLLYVEPDGTEESRVYSMACETARTFLEQKGQELKLPKVSKTGHFYIPFTVRPGNYYDGVSIAMLISGQVPADYWAGKIVLIGPCAAALQDTYFTPIDKGAQMYGVEIQANVVQSLLENRRKTEVSDLPQLIALFFICAAAMILFLRMKVGRGGGLCAGLIVFSALLTFILYKAGFVTHPLWLPFAVIILYVLALAAHYISAAKERQALALEKERIEAELSLAARIQLSALPKEFPPFPERKEFDLFASMTPAKEVGGDFYDFFLIDDDHLGLVIADASGKGVPASLFMMVSMALIRNAAMNEMFERSPAKVLQAVNRQICSRNPEGMFVTVWLGVLQISTGKLTASNAGHEYPALKQAGEEFELLKDRHGVVWGGRDMTRYREYELQLQPGAKVFVYTDGVAEAANAKDELFGTQRMIEALHKGQDGTPEEILNVVRTDIDAFVGNAPQFDDLTMLCLQYNGASVRGTVPVTTEECQGDSPETKK